MTVEEQDACSVLLSGLGEAHVEAPEMQHLGMGRGVGKVVVGRKLGRYFPVSTNASVEAESRREYRLK